MDRRLFTAGLAATGLVPLATPGLGQDRWEAVRSRAASFDRLHTMIVAQGGQRRIELAPGARLDRPANIKSVSKTIVATLTGIAIGKGALPGPEAQLGDVAPRLIPRGADPRVPQITVGDLLSMRAGLERTSGGNYGAWVSSPNWVADALSRPFVDRPGGRMLYSTGSTHVLGAVLSEVTGDSLLSLARQWLGRPLGIDIPPWTRDPQGRYLGGNQMALSPEAMLRFAEMIRAGGTWQGTQVVPEDWIEASLTRYTRSRWSGLGYGYGWFLGRAMGQGYGLARGYGGQVICVCPGLDLSVVITSDPSLPARSNGYFGELAAMIEEAVIPAAA